MILDFVYSAPLCGEEDTRPAIIAKVRIEAFHITAVNSHEITFSLLAIDYGMYLVDELIMRALSLYQYGKRRSRLKSVSKVKA